MPPPCLNLLSSWSTSRSRKERSPLTSFYCQHLEHQENLHSLHGYIFEWTVDWTLYTGYWIILCSKNYPTFYPKLGLVETTSYTSTLHNQPLCASLICSRRWRLVLKISVQSRLGQWWAKTPLKCLLSICSLILLRELFFWEKSHNEHEYMGETSFPAFSLTANFSKSSQSFTCWFLSASTRLLSATSRSSVSSLITNLSVSVLVSSSVGLTGLAGASGVIWMVSAGIDWGGDFLSRG